MQADAIVNGVEFRFVRRRYGRQTFTWLHYRNEDDAWVEYKTDPWMSVKIPQKDLERIAGEITASVSPEIELCEVCEMFDVQVLQDYWSGTDEHPEAGHSMFGLGMKPELGAGLRGFYMTPWFETLPELYGFCTKNIGKFREHNRENPDGPAPNATNWV